MGEGAAWRLVCLFLWAAQNRSDGDLSGMSDEDIELAIDFDGDVGAFVAALSSLGFLDGEEGARTIHDWAEHNPWAAGAEKRSEKSRWAALCKQYGRHEAAQMMPDYAARLPKPSQEQAAALPGSASGSLVAVPKSATGTPLAGNGSAPSPIPLPSPLPSPIPNSVPNGTGGTPPVDDFDDGLPPFDPVKPAKPAKPPKMTDPSEIIFGYGLSLLTSAGNAEKQGRSFLGGLRKTHGDDALINALRECAKAKPLQPLEWLAAALPPPSAGSSRRMPKPDNFAAKDYGSLEAL